MSHHNEGEGKGPGERFGEMARTFGDAISEIFNDPELKKKFKDFTDGAAGSAKAAGDRLKDEDVKRKFADFGRAAEDFGRSLQSYFEKKEKDED